MKNKGIHQQSNNNKWHIKTKKKAPYTNYLELEIPVLKKIEVIIVEHIAYEGHEDAELKYTRVASENCLPSSPQIDCFHKMAILVSKTWPIC